MGRHLNRISLSVLLLFQVLAAVSHQEADRRFQKLLACLSHPPSYTCVRASTHLAPLEEIRLKLAEELAKVKSFERFFVAVMIAHVQYSQRDDDGDVVEAADGQVFGRGGVPADSNSPTNSRCAASSRRWTQV